MNEYNTRGERREERKRNGSKMTVRGLTSVRLMQNRVIKAAKLAGDK